jgi:pimeloyl-ACP methyl ester carboxylesterase
LIDQPQIHHHYRGRVRTRIGHAVDTVAFQVMYRFAQTGHRAAAREEGARGMLSAWATGADKTISEIQRFYPKPTAPAHYVCVARKALRDGWVEDLRIDHPHGHDRPTAQALREEYPDNTLLHARHYRHSGAGHPAIVCLHGWGGGNYRVEAGLFAAKLFYDLGLDVLLYVHPYHGQRCPKETLVGARLHPSTHITRTNEAFIQTVWEVRSLVAFHQAHGGGPVGVIGMSLGGYASALLASVASELAFAIPMMPIADVAALIWSWGEGSTDRAKAEAEGVTFDDLCQAMAVHSPLASSLALDRSRVLLIGARGDRIVPPSHVLGLWEHWQRPEIHWFPGGHLTHFGRKGYLSDVVRFLRRREIVK